MGFTYIKPSIRICYKFFKIMCKSQKLRFNESRLRIIKIYKIIISNIN